MNNNDFHSALLGQLPASYKEWFDAEREYLASRISKDSSILEVGCGDGRSIADLLGITKTIAAIDHDPKAVHAARKRFADYPGVRIDVADATALPYAARSFDDVICMTSLVNFGDAKVAALREMHRVLSDHGRVIISVFSEHALAERLRVYETLHAPIKEIRGGTVIFDESIGDNVSEQFTREDIAELASDSGFIVEDVLSISIAHLCTFRKAHISDSPRD